MTTTPVKPFLLVSTRPEDDMAAEEHASFAQLMDIPQDCLVQRRVEKTPLGPVDLTQYSGLIIGGSPYNSSEPNKSDEQKRVESCLNGLIGQAIRLDFPTFGACYGVGIVGSAAGGTVCRTYGEPAGCVSITLTNEGRAEPLCEGLPDRFDALVGHKEACSELPDNATLLASGEHCPIQMFRVKNNLFVTQFHPELQYESFHHRLITYEQAGYFKPGTISSILATCDGKDLDVAPRLLVNFARRYGALTA